MENLISDVKGFFGRKIETGEGADTKYYDYVGMISICEVFLNIKNSTYIADSVNFSLQNNPQHAV